MPSIKVLSADDIAGLEEAKALIPALEEEIKLASSAGIDVSDMKAELASLKPLIANMLRVYKPRVTE